MDVQSEEVGPYQEHTYTRDSKSGESDPETYEARQKIWDVMRTK